MNGRRIAGVIAAGALVAGAAIACSHSAGHSAPQATVSHAAQADIFRLLPFNQAQLDAAYTSAAKASAAYETFTYTDTPATYGNRISAWVTPAYLTYLQQTFGNQVATAARGKLREHSTATSTVLSIRTFGNTSITFITAITQNDPATNDSGNYAVTVTTTDGKAWQVNDIEPAGAGN